MFESQLKSTGREYTVVIAWLAIGVIFMPALFLGVQPSYLSVSLAGLGSVVCVIMAWVNWKKSSKLSIPSISTTSAESK